MEISAEYIKSRFDYYNKLIFGSKLPVLPISIGRARKTLGAIKYKRKYTLFGHSEIKEIKMVISSYYSLSADEYDDIVIHEMIHYYIIHNKIKDTSSHGKVFRKLMTDINRKFDRNVCISCRGLNAEQSCVDNNKYRYVCMTELADGRIGITVAAKTRVFQLWELLPRLFPVTAFKWYCTRDSFFAKYPSAIKPKIYIVDKDSVVRHLVSAIELQNDGKTIKSIVSDKHHVF